MMKLADAFFNRLSLEEGAYNRAWGLNDKRPLGSQNVNEDILLLLGYKDNEIWKDRDNLELDPDLEVYAEKLYANLGTFLKNKWKEYKDAAGV
jgi:hypothetical protein